MNENVNQCQTKEELVEKVCDPLNHSASEEYITFVLDGVEDL